LTPNPTVESTHDELLNEGDQLPPREQYHDEIDGGREVIDIASAENANGGGREVENEDVDFGLHRLGAPARVQKDSDAYLLNLKTISIRNRGTVLLRTWRDCYDRQSPHQRCNIDSVSTPSATLVSSANKNPNPSTASWSV
jgi:hypothetical protein